MAEPERLQKYIARCGAASRRSAEEMILAGRVRVNGAVVRELGTKVNENNDKVYLDGKRLLPEQKKYYIMLNKPVGFITASADPFGRSTVLELVQDLSARLYPVGRLDYESEGLLFLTNDGDFTYHLTHPSHRIEKKYQVIVRGFPDNDTLWKLRRGVLLDGRMTAPARVELERSLERTSELTITISEGRNRQIRRMCESVGHEVLKLKRTAVGGISLGHLPSGKWRHLTEDEVKKLMREAEDR